MGWHRSPRRTTDTSSAARRSHLSRWHRRAIFQEMVRGELRCGRMSRRRHRRLVEYAAALGLDSVEGAALIDEARRALGLPNAPAAWAQTAGRHPEAVRPAPTWLIVSIIVMAVAIVHLLVFRGV